MSNNISLFRRELSWSGRSLAWGFSDLYPHGTPENQLGQTDTPRDGRQQLVLLGDDVYPNKIRIRVRHRWTKMPRTATSMWFGRKEW